jgi:tRNA-splicing ligase RtcB
MSRSAARKRFTPQQLTEAMGTRTWLAEHAPALVDESPAGYKDIDQVMADQADLVAVEVKLNQIVNYKGS